MSATTTAGSPSIATRSISRGAVLAVLVALAIGVVVATLSFSGGDETSGDLYHPFRDGYVPAQPM